MSILATHTINRPVLRRLVQIGQHTSSQMCRLALVFVCLVSIATRDVSGAVIRHTRSTADLPWYNPCAGSTPVGRLAHLGQVDVRNSEMEAFDGIASNANHLDGIVTRVKGQVADRINNNVLVEMLEHVDLTLTGLPNVQSLSIDRLLTDPNTVNRREEIVHESYEYLAIVAVYLEFARQVERDHTIDSTESIDSDLNEVEIHGYSIMCQIHAVIADWGGEISTTVTRDVIHADDRQDVRTHKDARAFVLLKQYSSLLQNLKRVFLFLKTLA